MPEPTSAEVLEAAARIIDGAQLASQGIAGHLEENPEIDQTTQQLLSTAAYTLTVVADLLGRTLATNVSLVEAFDKLAASMDQK